jgi:sugar/nucleoside kinase (ribokinase family)
VVVVVGDVMVDVVVRPLGVFNRGSDTPSRIAMTPGGSATNQAVALAAAGAEVHLVAVVGDDELGRAALRSISGSGVHAHFRALPGVQTGVVVSVVDAAGERSMLTDRGANLRLGDLGLVPDLLASGFFEAGKHLHLSGYELLDEATRAAGLSILRMAAESGMTRSVDPCSAGPLAAVGAANFLSWTEGVDWCCANLDEGRALTGVEDPTEVMAALRRHYREVTLTLGPYGALFSGPATDLVHCPAVPAAVADTTGAGDAFTGTFLGRRLHGDAPEEALRAALSAASKVVAVAGARPWS